MTSDVRAEPLRTPLRARSAALHLGRLAPAPGSCDPALRANAFSEVTRLFCRLPLPTLFYRLEASSLGDRMRLFGTDRKGGVVMPGGIPSLRFSVETMGAPDCA